MLSWQNHSAFFLAKFVYDFLRYNKVGMSKPKAQQPGQIEAVLCAGNSRDLLTVVELTNTTGSSSRRRGLWFYLLSLKFLVLAHALLLPIHGQTLNPKTLNWLVLKRSSSLEEHRSTSRDANSYFKNCLQQSRTVSKSQNLETAAHHHGLKQIRAGKSQTPVLQVRENHRERCTQESFFLSRFGNKLHIPYAGSSQCTSSMTFSQKRKVEGRVARDLSARTEGEGLKTGVHQRSQSGYHEWRAGIWGLFADNVRFPILIPELENRRFFVSLKGGGGISIKQQPWVNFKTLQGSIDFHDGIWKELAI